MEGIVRQGAWRFARLLFYFIKVINRSILISIESQFSNMLTASVFGRIVKEFLKKLKVRKKESRDGCVFWKIFFIFFHFSGKAFGRSGSEKLQAFFSRRQFVLFFKEEKVEHISKDLLYLFGGFIIFCGGMFFWLDLLGRKLHRPREKLDLVCNQPMSQAAVMKRNYME